MRSRIFYTILICMIGLSACRDPLPGDLKPSAGPPSGNGVYVINEGNFQFGNSTISYYDYQDTAVSNGIFNLINSRPLGDICQSMLVHNGKAYMVLNNSGKIEVVEEASFVSTGSITGFGSPRHILPVSLTKAYVSDLYSDKLSVVDLSNLSITGEIPLKGWSEEMAFLFGKAYVTNKESEFIYIIDGASDSLEDSIQVGYGSNSIREDKHGTLWVLCGGDEANGLHAVLVNVDPTTKSILNSFQFVDIASDPWRLRINGTGDTLYYLDKGVRRFSIDQASLPVQSYIPQSGRTFYGLGIDPVSGEIFVSDAIDFVQSGIIHRYSATGQPLHSFKAGIIPGDFYFR